MKSTDRLAAMSLGSGWGGNSSAVASARRVSGFTRFVALMVAATVVILAAALAARSSAFPALGQPAPQTQKKAMWGPTVFNGTPAFPIYRDLGVGIYETAVFWTVTATDRPMDPTNPGDPAYRWPIGLDQTIAEAESYGMEVAITILGTPPWANGNKSFKWAPTDPADFGNFATAIARRYPSVHLWHIWGEPNRKPNFAPFTAAPPKGPLNKRQKRAPRIYSQLLDAAYAGLKAVHPGNLVIGGNTFTAAGPGSIHTYQWIRYMRLPGGKRPRMDLYGHNPYSFRKPNLKAKPSPRGQVDFSDLRRLTRKLDRAFRGRRLKLFLGEWGVPTDKKDAELGFKVSRKTQVRWIRAALKITRRWGRIYTLGWVHPFDKPEDNGTQGLLDANGDPKPGYFAFKSG